MNSFKNDYMAHYSNGTKELIEANTTADAVALATELCPTGTYVSFITKADSDIPFSYDWDEKLQKWQGTLF